MADHTVGATGDYATIQAALDDGGVSGGDRLLLQSQAHSGTGNASITSAKAITILPQSVATPGFSSGARIICDQDSHIFEGYSAGITLQDLAVQSNTDSATSGFDGSNEVIRMDNAITFTATRCKFRMTAIADGTDEGDFSQVDAVGTFIFTNCEFTRFDRRVINNNFVNGVAVTFRHCTVYTPGVGVEFNNRTGTINLYGSVMSCAGGTLSQHATATVTGLDYILSDNPGSFDTSTNGTASATFADTTGASAVIFTSISGEDFSLQDHANNIALGYVPEARASVSDDITSATRTDDDHDAGCYEVSSAVTEHTLAVDIDLPMLTADATMVVARDLAVDVDLPVLEASAALGVERDLTVDIDLPGLEASGTFARVWDLTVGIELPMITADANFLSGKVLAVAIQLPMLTAEAVLGVERDLAVAVNLPGLEASASMVVERDLAVDIDLPMLEADAAMVVARDLAVDVDLPMLAVEASFASEVVVHTLAVAIDLPALEMAASLGVERDLAVDIELPGLEATAALALSRDLAVAIDLPGLEASAVLVDVPTCIARTFQVGVRINTTTGTLRLPRMTSTERDALADLAAGDLIYNSTTGTVQVYNGSTWDSLVT